MAEGNNFERCCDEFERFYKCVYFGGDVVKERRGRADRWVVTVEEKSELWLWSSPECGGRKFEGEDVRSLTGGLNGV